jgi:hypothetical protein
LLIESSGTNLGELGLFFKASVKCFLVMPSCGFGAKGCVFVHTSSVYSCGGDLRPHVGAGRGRPNESLWEDYAQYFQDV